MFGFDPKYAMFDITPVANQFILEYLPAAKGDYVKVYLYGLMRCYHPEEDMNLDRMCRELGMTEDNVRNAFAYWERKRLVRRISDNPPQWQYINMIQINLTEPRDDPDPEYTEFCNALYEAFDKKRRLHGSELNTCFEWREDLKLPTEVIIMLLNHMMEIKGKNFRISDADKVAVQMAAEEIRTVETAEEYFSRDEKVLAGIKKILKMLGKKYLPSEAQINLYRKWTRDWGFSHESVEAAVELTAKGDPSLGYLDGILSSLRQEGSMTPEQIRTSSLKTDRFKEVLKELGKGEISKRNLQLYDEMLSLYPQDVILVAARECGHSGKDAGETLKLLQSWKEKGLKNKMDVDQYVQTFHDQTDLIRQLKKLWGTDEGRIGKADRSLIQKWENDLHFGPDIIMAAAAYAAEAKQPMNYLDKILEEYRAKGISTPEEVRKEHELKPVGSRKKPARILPAQDFAQRPYDDVPDKMIAQLDDEVRAFMKENGGESDA